MAKFEEIDKARKLLGLGERATLKELKHAYKQMAFRHHPDITEVSNEDDQVIKQLNWAYALLQDYFDNYSYSFSRWDVLKTYSHEEYLSKFFQD